MCLFKLFVLGTILSVFLSWCREQDAVLSAHSSIIRCPLDGPNVLVHIYEVMLLMIQYVDFKFNPNIFEFQRMVLVIDDCFLYCIMNTLPF